MAIAYLNYSKIMEQNNNVLTRFSNGNGQVVISALNVVLKAIAP